MIYKDTLNAVNRYIEVWVILGLTIFLIGYFIFPSSGLRNTFFYLGVCTPLTLLLPTYYKQLKPQTWLTATALAFAFYLFLNSLWSIHYSSSQSLKYLKYLLILYCLFAAVFLVQQKKPNYSELLFKAFIVIGFFHSLYGIFDHLNNIANPFLTRYNDPIDSAMLAGLLLLTCVWQMLENITWKQRLIYIILSIPFIIIILLSKARGPQLSFILTIPILLYFSGQNIKKIIPPLLILFLFTSIFLITSNAYEHIFSRGLTLPYRPEIWKVSFRESLEYFWFGQGASHNPLISISSTDEKFIHSHNVILVIFRMSGIVGVILFSTNLVLCFIAGKKNDKSQGKIWIVWLFFGILCMMTNGKYLLTRPNDSWLVYWVPLAFICASYSKFLPINYNFTKN